MAITLDPNQTASLFIPKSSNIPVLTVRQHINTIKKDSSAPAIPTIHVIRMKRRTPNMFCMVGKYTPSSVPSRV